MKKKRSAVWLRAAVVAAVFPWVVADPLPAQPPGERPPACILIWLDGGPPMNALWDPQPGSPLGAIDTAGDMQISAFLPRTARVMDRLSVVCNVNSREGSHDRGQYYMLTGFISNPSVTHPTIGAVVSHAVGGRSADGNLPAFISIGGRPEQAGYLGLRHAPWLIDYRGLRIRAAAGTLDAGQLARRRDLLRLIETGFAADRSALLAEREAFRENLLRLLTDEDTKLRRLGADADAIERYGDNEFGYGLALARQLVAAGVPFVEVTFPRSWDVRQDYLPTVRNQLLPVLDRGLAGLVSELSDSGLGPHVVVVVAAAHSRTYSRHDRWTPWTRRWPVVIGGGGLKGGIAVEPTGGPAPRSATVDHAPNDLWATVLTAMGISLETVHTSSRGRPMKIVNGGTPIGELQRP